MIDYTPDEFKKLHEVILNLTGVDVFENKRRLRKVVNSKMIYSKILRYQGFTYDRISKSLNMNHASIVHHVRTINNLLQYDEEIKKIFNSVVSAYELEYYEKTKEDANIENIALKAEIEMLKTENKKLNEFGRLGSIFKLLKDNLPSGSEKKMELIIRRSLAKLR